MKGAEVMGEVTLKSGVMENLKLSTDHLHLSICTLGKNAFPRTCDKRHFESRISFLGILFHSCLMIKLNLPSHYIHDDHA